jgi:putative hydroxymethylpyrimidine transport system substrate-binding protein
MIESRWTRTGALLAAIFVVVVVAGCGERDEAVEPGDPVEFELLLDFFPNADHAPIYAAEANGRFDAVGLDLQIRQPADPSAPIEEVAAGRVDLALSYEPEVIRARAEGLPVVSVGALVQEPLTSIISLPEARISQPADLRGKRVGTAGIDYQAAYLDTILERAGVSPGTVDQRDLGFNLSAALLTGQVDAVLGAFWNYEGTQLRLRGRQPDIIRVEQVGIPRYDELVLVANEDALADDPGLVRSFIGALEQGADDLRRDPSEGVQALLEENPDLDPELQRQAVEVTMPLFQPPAGEPYGFQDPEQWEAFGQFLAEEQIVTEAPEGAFTNEYLPGEGLE